MRPSAAHAGRSARTKEVRDDNHSQVDIGGDAGMRRAGEGSVWACALCGQQWVIASRLGVLEWEEPPRSEWLEWPKKRRSNNGQG